MNKFFPLLLLFVFLAFSFRVYRPGFYLHPGLVGAVDEETSTKIKDIKNEIDRLSASLKEARQKKTTLSNQISYMDGQIRLTSLKIKQTLDSISFLEEQINKLSEKIGRLDVSLDNLSVVFLNRVVATYKADRTSSFLLIFSSDGFSNLFRRWGYFRSLQLNDRKIMLSLEETRVNYSLQKEEKEKKQVQLERLKRQLADQKTTLDKQKKDKEYLLQVTRNDEKRYQRLLAQTRAEYQAIQAVLAGGGNEVEVGEIKKGEVIATIISGSSCNSSGTHLHFTVVKDGKAANPFDFLKGGVSYENCSGSKCGSGDGDPFNPSGSWDWPINQKISFNQGYGSTWAVNHTWAGNIYKFHNGIDVRGSSSETKAVQDGTLYRGSYTGYNSCRLRYVRVKHKNSSVSSYYLHVNYSKV